MASDGCSRKVRHAPRTERRNRPRLGSPRSRRVGHGRDCGFGRGAGLRRLEAGRCAELSTSATRLQRLRLHRDRHLRARRAVQVRPAKIRSAAGLQHVPVRVRERPTLLQHDRNVLPVRALRLPARGEGRRVVHVVSGTRPTLPERPMRPLSERPLRGAWAKRRSRRGSRRRLRLRVRQPGAGLALRPGALTARRGIPSCDHRDFDTVPMSRCILRTIIA